MDALNIEHTLHSPDPANGRVGRPAIALTAEGKAQFLDDAAADILSGGWVDSWSHDLGVSRGRRWPASRFSHGRLAAERRGDNIETATYR
ncbi:MAG: hypothetical protein NTW58_11045 [Actinobacteria bacterium]|nr:hypothetical protein [Actinomycetota bacterium]